MSLTPTQNLPLHIMDLISSFYSDNEFKKAGFQQLYAPEHIKIISCIENWKKYEGCAYINWNRLSNLQCNFVEGSITLGIPLNIYAKNLRKFSGEAEGKSIYCTLVAPNLSVINISKMVIETTSRKVTHICLLNSVLKSYIKIFPKYMKIVTKKTFNDAIIGSVNLNHLEFFECRANINFGEHYFNKLKFLYYESNIRRISINKMQQWMPCLKVVGVEKNKIITCSRSVKIFTEYKAFKRQVQKFTQEESKNK